MLKMARFDDEGGGGGFSLCNFFWRCEISVWTADHLSFTGFNVSIIALGTPAAAAALPRSVVDEMVEFCADHQFDQAGNRRLVALADPAMDLTSHLNRLSAHPQVAETTSPSTRTV